MTSDTVFMVCKSRRASLGMSAYFNALPSVTNDDNNKEAVEHRIEKRQKTDMSKKPSIHHLNCSFLVRVVGDWSLYQHALEERQEYTLNRSQTSKNKMVKIKSKENKIKMTN